MNRSLQLRYTHADHTRVLRDVRREQMPEVKWAHVYYVGFRILADSDERYHHALILADDYGTFLDGVAGEFNAIRGQSTAISFNDISLVFVRNLMACDPEMVASANAQNITLGIRDDLSRCDDNEYLVFGMVGESRICLIQANACDALTAIHRARSKSIEQFKDEFMPLEVCQAHPVTAECYALFDTAAERIKSLIDGVSTGSGYLH